MDIIKHKIKSVEEESIAHELDLQAGDTLLTINGQPVSDVLDYRFMIQEEDILIEIEKANGEVWELEIEKDEEEDLGLIFETDLMDEMRTCHNKCIFCFMDQMPTGMRSSLYLKDDDPRLSFLQGNYVTLTNLTEKEADRIANYHLSPLHISVHVSNPDLRCKMLNNKHAGGLFKHIHKFNNAGIIMHFQIVLCKGINDGKVLDDTINDLLNVSNMGSLSVVPVGLSKHRQGLFPLQPFLQEDARQVIKQVEQYKKVYCADEWYIKAGLDMPPYEYYDNFPQLENGVGMCALFEREYKQTEPMFSQNAGIVTGEAAEGLIRKLTDSNLNKVYAVKNDFFGNNVTVSGLLTGKDIIMQLKEKVQSDGCTGLYLPSNMFRAGTDTTLDNMSRGDIEQQIGLPIWVN